MARTLTGRCRKQKSPTYGDGNSNGNSNSNSNDGNHDSKPPKNVAFHQFINPIRKRAKSANGHIQVESSDDDEEDEGLQLPAFMKADSCEDSDVPLSDSAEIQTNEVSDIGDSEDIMGQAPLTPFAIGRKSTTAAFLGHSKTSHRQVEIVSLDEIEHEELDGKQKAIDLSSPTNSVVAPDEHQELGGSVVKFSGKSGDRRCLAIGRGGELCSYVANTANIYCQQHIGLTNPVLRLANKKELPQEEEIEDQPVVESKQRRFPSRRTHNTDDNNTTTSINKSTVASAKSVKRNICLATTHKMRRCTLTAKYGSFCHNHKDSGMTQQTLINMQYDNFDLVTTSEPLRDYLSSDSVQQIDGNDVDTDDDSAERPYTHKEFLAMWRKCEDYCGEVTEEIESTRRVRGANSKIAPEDSDGQLKAQYGRLLPKAMKRLMQKIMCLGQGDVFLDIGHGIGNTCLQAAFSIGCEARGIEVVFGRQSVAEVFRDNLVSQYEEDVSDGKKRIIGNIDLKHGRLEDKTYRDFLTKGVTRAYVNNFNGVFAERSSKGNDKYFLDDFVAGLFAKMQAGTILVSLHPLNLGPTRSEANKTRKKHGLTESSDASFYEVDRILLGKACDTVKWNQFSGNQKDIYVYKYTRVQQSKNASGTVFMCCNPACELATDNVHISATNEVEGRLVMGNCPCKFTRKNLRRQTRKSYSAF